MSWLRTHNCGELTIDNKGETVTLNGWVSTRRDLGGLIFIDLRDRYGVTQIVFGEKDKDLHEVAEQLRSEYVIGIRGEVLKRSDETINPEMSTGEVEIKVSEIRIYSKAETPPFEIKDDIATNEEMRLRYRYLDLRRKKMQKNLLLRSKVCQTVRNFYSEKDFAEVETPVLMRSTPEGARDYLVPSRVNPGKFFALPQSPQTYKQILMVAGMDRYFQIVKCFRDEDLRADRQPEFTQIDVELSFVDEEEVFRVHEQLMVELWRKHMNKKVEFPFPRITYKEAMQRYGTDKPDTRFDMEISDLSDIVEHSEFKIFQTTVKKGGKVLAINVPGEGKMGRGALDRLTEEAKRHTGAAGMIYIKVEEDNLNCSVGKFLTDQTVQKMADRAGANRGDLVLIFAGPQPDVYKQMGALRLMMGKDLGLIDTSASNFLWVTDFPLVEWDKDEKRYFALHHPFTSPRDEDMDKLESDPASVNARAYDLVLNGSEIGGGSIRIHDPVIQQKMFSVLGIDEQEAREKFGFLLDAFTYGAPPHGGIALGLDRIIMLMAGADSLREVIAFPKNQKAQSLMDNCPDTVDKKQLDELHIKLKEDVKN
ncbi:MAG TPA: aspartate--tRNA ligase [Balneolaceae bacterium]|nr:aspartate--tRNA ligase [Balneolaceae bacterium]